MKKLLLILVLFLGFISSPYADFESWLNASNACQKINNENRKHIFHFQYCQHLNIGKEKTILSLDSCFLSLDIADELG